MNFFLLWLSLNTAQAMTIDEYRNKVLTENKLVSAYNESISASEDKREAGDLDLATVLTASYNQATDSSLPSIPADKRAIQNTNLTLSKKFSTGTGLSLTAETHKYDNTSPALAFYQSYSSGNLGVSINQSLLKWGSDTRLRQQRESYVQQAESAAYELQKRSLLIKADADFWDYTIAKQQFKLKQDNLNRISKLKSWTSKRYSDGVAEQTDLLQIQALEKVREFEVSAATENLKAAEVKIRENLNLKDSDSTPDLTSVEDKQYTLASLETKKNMVKLDSYISKAEASTKSVVSEEVANGLRPDITLVGQYKSSSYDKEYNEMLKNIEDTDRPITYIGVSFSWILEGTARNAKLNAAKKESLAAQLKAEQNQTEGENSWKDYLRKYKLAQVQTDALKSVYEIQKNRAKAEQSKYSQGRTIASVVVNAETDAAEAEVNYLSALSGLRKIQTMSQLYISTEQ